MAPTLNTAETRIYLDSETVGLHGMPVLLQFAVEEGPIVLYQVWKHPIGETLDLIEWFMQHTIVGFNLVFDHFMLVKLYTTFRLCPREWIPEEHIDDIALKEPEAQNGPALKPANALDLLLHSRKGPYQSLMARSDVRIRRVPTALAYALADELEQRVEIDGIYFARSHDKDAPRWQVFDIKKRDGDFDPDFKDVVLRFNPAGGLKFLAEHALGYQPKFHYKDVELDLRPKELGYAPTALAVSSPDRKWEVYKVTDGERKLVGHAWPGIIKQHIDHWATNENAREYARDDITYTRDLAHYFAKLAGVERLPAGDDDSILACMVPVIRWRGFKIDSKGMRGLYRKARAKVKASPVNINKPAEVRAYVYECMDDMEKVVLESSTKKANLQAVAKWEADVEECTKCDGQGQHAGGTCLRCEGTGKLHPVCDITDDHGNHPAALRAHDILAVKIAGKEVELYKKLIKAKKFHASFNVIGTLSTRMSGGDGLNAQGIKATKEVRCMFPLAWEGYELCGGDFDSFEVTLADAVYKDPDLRKALTTKVACHKCDATGRVKKCKGCKGKGKADGRPCDACGGRGRFTITPADACFLECPECDECDATGKTTKKIHALFAMCLFPGKTYEEIVASAGTQNDMYTKGKQGVFAMIYGGDFNTLVRNLGLAVEVAKAAFDTWNKWFPKSAKARERTFKAFCSMKQPEGIGGKVIWGTPDDYVESFLGFRRYFTLENTITKALYDLSRKLPEAWRKCKIKVVRRNRVQFASGAVSSALYGAAFQIQAGNQRAAANHEIQSPGGQITKAVQRDIWDLQPTGIHPLYVAPMNVHDELMCVTHPDYVQPVAEKVRNKVNYYRERPEGSVPLIGMTWCLSMTNWAEKKGSATTLKMRSPLMEAA